MFVRVLVNMIPKLLLVIVFTIVCVTYEASGNIDKLFPTQLPNINDRASFYRTSLHHSGLELLTCPDHYLFDPEELKCIRGLTEVLDGQVYNGLQECPEDLRGTIANKEDCSKFINCWDGVGFLQSCAGHLLYNVKKNYCDWPEEAGCCEYWEEDSTQLVS